MMKAPYIIAIIVAFIALILFVVLGSEKLTVRSLESPIELISFLKERKLASAVVQKLVNNEGGVWVVTSGGEKKFVYSSDLGSVCSPLCSPNYRTALDFPSGWNVAISPDKTYLLQRVEGKTILHELYTNTKPSLWSREKEVYRGEVLGVNLFDHLYHNSLCGAGDFSPDGTMFLRTLFSPHDKGTELFEVVHAGIGPTFPHDNPTLEVPLKLVSRVSSTNMCDIAWSADSTYAIMRDYGTIPHNLSIAGGATNIWYFDQKENTTKKIGEVADENMGKIIYVVAPNEIVIANSSGTYLLSLGESENSMRKLLPQDIKLVGIIP